MSDVNHYDPAANDSSLPRRDRPFTTTYNTIENLEQALAQKDAELAAAHEQIAALAGRIEHICEDRDEQTERLYGKVAYWKQVHSQEAEAMRVSAESVSRLQRQVEQLRQANGNAFVAGAAWWEHQKTNATMFPSDKNLAAQEALRRGYVFRDVDEVAYERQIEQLRAEMAQVRQGEQITGANYNAAKAEAARMEQENAGLKAEVEWLKGQLKNDPDGERGCMCVYCGNMVVYDPSEGIQAAVDAARSHDRECSANPLVARIADLERLLPAVAVCLRQRFSDVKDGMEFQTACELADAISSGHLAWICPHCSAPNSVQNDACWNCDTENGPAV